LVFVKGNPDIATELIKNGDNFVCRVNGNLYRSFREAAIDIDPNELVATEVERRCRSTKSKYKEWQIIGEETKPTIRYQINGIPFESPKQIMNLIGGDITENQIRGWIDSNNPQWRHWIKVESNVWDITYDEMESLWSGDIQFELPTVECDGKQFISQKDAAEYFGISSERVRQKLNSDKYISWKYLF
jgi:hypothetical protein